MYETTPKMLAKNSFTDIIGVNLQYPLDTYYREELNPMTNDGVTVAGFWDKSKGILATQEYELDEWGVYVRKELDKFRPQ